MCYAESKEKLSLAYANRSAVYLELKRYDECLQNIKLARENDYPTAKIQKLNEREEKCKKMMEEEVKDPEDDPRDYFKLTYPPNPKIPFMVDCLEMRKSEKYDRGIYTTRDLKPGDIVAIEEPILFRMFCSGQYNCCCLCMKVSMMNLIPCLKTASMMFCSEECRTKVYNDYGDDLKAMIVYAGMEIDSDRIVKDIEQAFGGHKKLLKFLTANDLTRLNTTYFDFDMSDKNHPKYKENLMKCFLSLKTKFAVTFTKFPLIPPTPKTTKGKSQIVDLINHLRDIVQKNLLDIKYTNYTFAEQVCPEVVHDGFQISCIFWYFNHSCMSNVIPTFVDNKTAIIVTKPIKAGEQLFGKL